MLATRIIPCLDVRHGRVVKGIKFSGLKDAGDPVQLARLYEEQKADELILLDVSATPEERSTALDTVRKVRKCLSIPFTVGGGIHCLKDAQALLENGADKVALNTAAVENPGLLEEIATQFGRQCTVLALDAARTQENGWEVVIYSGKKKTGIDVIDWARQATEKGAGEIMLTSWDRDGTRLGYDLELLSAVSNAVSVPIIASGGASTPQHLLDAIRAGASAVLAASIFHYGEYTVLDLKNFLENNQVEVRT
jgi:imidazoleglycerol phosphate synthase cyclase subunit